MSTHKNLFTLCFAVVFALGLAACGGGGSGPALMDDNGDTVGDVSLEGKYIPSGATIAVEDVPDGMIPLEGGAMLDLAGLGTVECVSVDGCLGTVENGVLTIMGNLKIVSVDPALDSDTAMLLAEVAVDMLPGPAGPTPEEATEKALAIAMALTNKTEAGENGVPTAAAVTRSTEAAGGEIEVTVTSGAPTDDGYAMSEDMSPPAIDKWNGQTHMRSPEDEPAEVVNIYTNIKMAEGNKLVYDNDTGGDTGDDAPDFPTLGTGSEIVLADSMKTSYASNDGEDEVDAESVMGTYNGIPGTFTCAEGTCTVTFVSDPGPGVDAGTVQTLGNAGWAFESTENHESVAEQQSDYLYFGYWLQMANVDGEYGFATFAGGGDEFDTGDTPLTDLEGRATYNGAAGGKYVTKELALVDGMVDTASASGGYFTATAMLTATFGGGAIPLDDHDKITGTISNFKDGVTGDDLGFTVNLSAGIVGTGIDMPVVTAAHGSLPNTGGTWDATFFGPNGVNDPDTADVDEQNTTLPTGIAGNFDAHFADGNVVGSYAATR